MKKKVAVVCGGYSKEYVISIKSAEQIANTINADLFDVYKVSITKNEWVAKVNDNNYPIDKNDFSFLLDNKKITFDVVVMAIHGTPGEDGKLQAYFEMLNIPVTTCNSFVSSLTFNKYANKLYLKEFGILTANSVLLTKGVSTINTKQIIDKLGFPMFVKPNNGGSSFGVTKVMKAEQLQPAIEKAFAEDYQIIIEEFIEGREFTCGCFKYKGKNTTLPITEIVSKNDFFDYEAKYEGLADEITPADLPKNQYNECQQLTSDIYSILNCSGIVRIDYLQKDNKFYFMEANTVPGMSAESIIPKQAKAFGISLSELFTTLINSVEC